MRGTDGENRNGLGDHTSSDSIQGDELGGATSYRMKAGSPSRIHTMGVSRVARPCCSIEARGTTKGYPQQHCQDRDVSHWTGRFHPAVTYLDGQHGPRQKHEQPNAIHRFSMRFQCWPLVPLNLYRPDSQRTGVDAVGRGGPWTIKA